MTTPQQLFEKPEDFVKEALQSLRAMREAAIIRLGEAQHRQHDSNADKNPREFRDGDRVWMDRGENQPVTTGTRKMVARRQGPFKITWVEGNVAKLEPDGAGLKQPKGTVSTSRLSKCPEQLHK